MNKKYLIEEQTLKDIANSIRTLEGKEDSILVEDFATRIINMETVTLEEYMYITEYVCIHPGYIQDVTITPDEQTECQHYLDFYATEEEI